MVPLHIEEESQEPGGWNEKRAINRRRYLSQLLLLVHHPNITSIPNFHPMQTHTTSVLLFSFLAVTCGSILSSERSIVESSATTLVLRSWVNLLPKLVSCYMALAGIFSLTTNLCIPHIQHQLSELICSILSMEAICHLLAGCHLCTFFLGTYDMSVAAPACTTSCSLALFKTCSSLLAASLQQRLN